jgi:iron(II)-dependent oxidoreductase
VLVPGGPFTMGTSTEAWALDNERPAHTVDVPAFFIDAAPVTNAQYAAFVDETGANPPLHWTRDPGGWLATEFGRTAPIVPAAPVVHVSFHEAKAYAAWAGRRLPSEAEWEKAARWDPATGRSRRYPWGDEDPGPQHANLGQRHLTPAPVGAYPAGASPLGVHQLIGDVWEWVDSDFTGYPGFTAFPYREYSEVFFGPEYKVLRGGSFGTDAAACRGTFRNWDYPIRRQIFSGFRTARDAHQRELA